MGRMSMGARDQRETESIVLLRIISTYNIKGFKLKDVSNAPQTKREGGKIKIPSNL